MITGDLIKFYFVSLNTVVNMFISYIEKISNVGGILGSFKSENNNQEIQLHVCNYLNIVALDACF
jgi:hypothetical protein